MFIDGKYRRFRFYRNEKDREKALVDLKKHFPEVEFIRLENFRFYGKCIKNEEFTFGKAFNKLVRWVFNIKEKK